MSKKLTCAGLGEPHQMLDFEVVIQFGTIFARKSGRFLAFEQVPDPLAGDFRGLELDQLARSQRGDEFNDFFVSLHPTSMAFDRFACKAAGGKGRDGNCRPRERRRPAGEFQSDTKTGKWR
jgi:hypothetical protein